MVAHDREFRASVAALALLSFGELGTTLEDVLHGEAGRRWVAEFCGGDRELAAEALELVYPGTPVPWAFKETLF